jgi:two-component system, OmpR family, sensor histidine kinase KdpD
VSTTFRWPVLAGHRRWFGVAVAVLGLATLTALLRPLQGTLSLAGVTLLYLVPVVAAAALGGVVAALLTAVCAALLVNFFFLTPYHTFAVDSPASVVVLVVYVLVAATVAVAVDVAVRHRATAERRAAQARELAEVDRLRAALLDAVGHDLRTPLAGIKAAASSLRQPDVMLGPDDRAALLATVEECTDRRVALVENLLSVSRLQAGVLSVEARPAALDAVVAEAVLRTPERHRVAVDLPDDLPLGHVDPGLLERVCANLLANALTATAPDGLVKVAGEAGGGMLRLRVIDHGPGLSPAAGDRAFEPFRRLDDRGQGLGLGLAIARGFTEAMGGTLTPSRTPGGGLTMTIAVPRADEP